jgi:hypothetical protein
MSKKSETSRAKSTAVLSTMVLLGICAAFTPKTLARYSGGTGEPNDPYRISTPEDLNDIGNYEEDWDKHFILVNDVKLAQYTGTQFKVIGNSTAKFTGVFDGNDHKISNFTWSSTGRNCIGLFGYIDEGGQIKNLGLENVDVNAVNGQYIGGLVGYNSSGVITNCYSTGSVSGVAYTGGLVGFNSLGTITSCYSSTSVSGKNSIGGLIGDGRGMISYCYSTGNVSGTQFVGGLVGGISDTMTSCYSSSSVSGTEYVGGLAGWNSSNMTDCYSTGKVSGTKYNVGGLVGCHSEHRTIANCYSSATVLGGGDAGGLAGSTFRSTITNCYSTGSVSGEYGVGGLVGCNFEYSTITNCYSTGSVLGTGDVGGLAGRNWSDSIIMNSYSVGSVSGTKDVGGLVGDLSLIASVTDSFWDIETSSQSTSDGGAGKTTAEMKTANTFLAWGGCGNESIWTIDEGNDYPRLAWENKPGQPLPEYLLSDFLEGSGTEDEPYLISTAEQLNLIGLFVCEWDKHFKLTEDIDLSRYKGNSFNIIGRNEKLPFIGVFDGNGKRIWNFTWNSTETYCIGLFGYVGSDGQIKNLGLENVDVNELSGWYVAGLVGWNAGNVTHCYSTGKVSGTQYYVGGLIGTNRGTITDCYSAGNVDGNDYVGGLVGANGFFKSWYIGVITNCYSTASVSGTKNVGGLLGYNGPESVVTASFWDIETSGEPNSAGGEPKTTAEMKTISTFISAGWDFIEIWGIGEGQTYPYLRFAPAGDFNYDKKVDLFDLAILASHWLENTP